MRRFMLLALAALAPASLAAAVPSALERLAAGEWEVSGAPGAKEPVRLCVSDLLALAQFEHRGRSCSRTVLSDADETAVVKYSCGAGDFGQSRIDVVTPRALRISTQGISDELPFNYVIQARRVGECEKSASTSSH